MVDNPRRPLLNPVLRFTKEPKPEGVSGGGKNAGSIMAERLPEQRRVLSRQFRALAAQAAVLQKALTLLLGEKNYHLN